MPHDHAIQCVHDPILVLLSFVIAVLGSYTALQIAIGIPAARTSGQRWQAVLAGGIALGAGAIWSMHFIGMLACKMDIPVTYDLGLTVVSAVIAIVSCMAGLAIAGIGEFGWGKLALAGLFMGLGVAGMHYSGMAAMQMPATTHYDMGMVGLSILVAVVASTVALWLAFNLRGWVQMLGSALVMGVAVCGMHYTGMYAAQFMPAGADAALSTVGGLGGDNLGMGVFAVATVLLTVMLVMTMQRRQKRAAVSI